MTRLHCLGCGILVATVHDTRFGLAPESCVCWSCARPAYRPFMS